MTRISPTTICNSRANPPSIPASRSLLARRASRGFTLIELLVAATIAALLSSFALLSFNIGSGEERLREEARRLFQLTSIAGDDAVFKTTEFGLRLTHSDYTFYTLVDNPSASSSSVSSEKKSRRRWVAVSEAPQLRSREWPEEIEVELFVEGLPVTLDEERDPKAEAKDERLRPHLLFLSNGEVIPNVEMHLRSAASEKAWRIGFNEDGVLALAPLEE
ncbi:MAG: type II secretion system minor pseudopilin GspH [Pseudomonadota bacterium]